MTTTPKTHTPQTPADTQDGTLLQVPEQQDAPQIVINLSEQFTPPRVCPDTGKGH